MDKFGLGIETLEDKIVLTPVVAIIDSGIDLNHNALKNYVWNNTKEISSNGIDDDNNGYIDDIHGWNFYDNNNNVQDCYGHGTHVAGIITSYGPVQIMVLKFQNDKGLGYTGDIIKAINYAIDMKKNHSIDIVAINNSWGGTSGYSSLLEDAIKRANDNNIVFVTSAGNTGTNHDITPKYPSSYNQTNIISVAALDFSGTDLPGYSDYGKNTVSIAAAGTSVWSTLPNNTYGYMSGTSMAAPQITGAVSALCYKFGDLSVEQIKNKIFSTVNRLESLTNKVIVGGSLNIQNALGGDTQFKVSVPIAISSQPLSVVSVVSRPWVDNLVSKIDISNINRVRGFVFNKSNIHESIVVKILINNQIVYTIDANKPRNDLRKYGDKYHGFDIVLGRKLFKKGWNEFSVIAENKLTGETKIISHNHIRRIV